MKRLLILLICSMFFSCTQKEEQSIEMNDVAIFKNTPVNELSLAVKKQDVSSIQKLLKSNAELVNKTDPKYGFTLLMWAIRERKFQSVKTLLEHKADPNIKSKTGTTALFLAIAHSKSDITASEDNKYVELLLAHNANPNITYCSPKIEGEKSPIECGTSPLMYAVSRGLNKVKDLVNAGANINYKNENGKTAAIIALLMEKVDVAYYLIVEKKAKVSDAYYFNDVIEDTKINYDKPHQPIKLLEDWLYDLNSEEYKMKMAIVEEFKNQGINYWDKELHQSTINRIKKLYPKTWEEYIKQY